LVKSARERWFERLRAEPERRSDAELLIDGQHPREALLAKLEEMNLRLRADPDFVEPGSRGIDHWLRERFPKVRWRDKV
jgi:hypothetical protein